MVKDVILMEQPIYGSSDAEKFYFMTYSPLFHAGAKIHSIQKRMPHWKGLMFGLPPITEKSFDAAEIHCFDKVEKSFIEFPPGMAPEIDCFVFLAIFYYYETFRN